MQAKGCSRLVVNPVQSPTQNALMNGKMLLDMTDVPALPSVRLKTTSERLVCRSLARCLCVCSFTSWLSRMLQPSVRGRSEARSWTIRTFWVAGVLLVLYRQEPRATLINNNQYGREISNTALSIQVYKPLRSPVGLHVLDRTVCFMLLFLLPCVLVAVTVGYRLTTHT
jgi:hypothetical protein